MQQPNRNRLNQKKTHHFYLVSHVHTQPPSTINRCLICTRIHAHTRENRHAGSLRVVSDGRWESEGKGVSPYNHLARSFLKSLALIPRRSWWVGGGRCPREKLWKASPVVRPSAIDNIRRRMCSLPRPWPTWPVSDSASPACVASGSTGTACPIPRAVPRP